MITSKDTLPLMALKTLTTILPYGIELIRVLSMELRQQLHLCRWGGASQTTGYNREAQTGEIMHYDEGEG